VTASSTQFVCPSVASQTGDWSAMASANAKCGDTIVINGFGLTEVTSVQFAINDAGSSQVIESPQASLKILSDDFISAVLNAPGDHTYQVAVKTLGSSSPIVVGELSVGGACPVLPGSR
jgi:hypothetical protein